MALLTIKNVYKVRIATSEGNSERLVEAASTMEAFRQTLLHYSPDALLYSLSVQPYRGSAARGVAA